jgi:Ni,Fe-hydrogenase I cytochrome b subunit
MCLSWPYCAGMFFAFYINQETIVVLSVIGYFFRLFLHVEEKNQKSGQLESYVRSLHFHVLFHFHFPPTGTIPHISPSIIQ